MTRQCERFADLMSDLYKNLNILNRDESVCCRMSMSQCFVLDYLARHSPAPMNLLSNAMGLTVSTMTRIIDVLVRDGYVARAKDPRDRRKVCVELTPAGGELAGRLTDCYARFTAEILTRIPSPDRAELIRALELLNQALLISKQTCCSA